MENQEKKNNRLLNREKASLGYPSRGKRSYGRSDSGIGK